MTRILVFVISTLGLVPPGAVFGDAPQLVVLIADRGSAVKKGGIYKLNIHNWKISPVPIEKLNAPFAIDYDQMDGLIYFTDITAKELRRADTSGENDVIVAKLNSTSSPEGIALDSKARLVFYTDNGNDLLGRVDMVSLNHTVIVNTGLDKPRGIVADTRNKRLYWVDFGANPKIETSDYNGEQKSTLIYSGLGRPYGITLDENAGRLYWTDADGIVGSVLVTGKERRTLTEDKQTMNDISLFNDFIYYTDFHDALIHSSTIGQSVEGFTVSSGYLVNPTGIHVYSPNFNITAPCSYGQFGPDCLPCGKCSFTVPCEKTTGSCFGRCQPGYRQETCHERCSPGTFGEDCLSRCSDNCRTGSVCDFINGSCPAGCQSEWSGYNCTERIFESTTDRQISSPPIGIIVGAVVGGVVIIAVVVVVVVVLIVRRKRKQEESYDKCDDIAMGQDNSAYTSLDFVNSNTT